MEKLDVRFHKQSGEHFPVGQLALADHRIFFEYDADFPDSGKIEYAYSLMARDDHVKNFAFIMGDDKNWSLSPAYDLMFS